MVKLLGHRRTKGAETDKPDLQPRRHISTPPLQMLSPAVPLGLAPASEITLRQLPPATPVWIASTPEMQSTLDAARKAGLTVTELFHRSASPEERLFDLDSVDQHHNSSSQEPGYTKLLVYGVSLSARILPLLSAFGFVSSEPEPFGFSASKAYNPLKRSANGMARWPSSAGASPHFALAVLRAMPLAPA